MCCMCVCVCERAHTRSCVYHHEMYHSSSGLHGDGKLASFQDVARAGLARTVYIYVYIHRIFGDFQAKNTVCTPYIYGSGQNHTYIRYFGQENHQIYGHMQCMYTVFWAGKSPNIRSYAVYIHGSGQPYIYTVYIRYFWQGNHQIYGHMQCIYTVRANPTCERCRESCFASSYLGATKAH